MRNHCFSFFVLRWQQYVFHQAKPIEMKQDKVQGRFWCYGEHSKVEKYETQTNLIRQYMALQKRKSIIDNACFICGKQVCYLDFTVIALDHWKFITLGTTLPFVL